MRQYTLPPGHSGYVVDTVIRGESGSFLGGRPDRIRPQDYWVTIVPQTFPSVSSVLSWCTSNDLDQDHCSAQQVGKTQDRSGTHG